MTFRIVRGTPAVAARRAMRATLLQFLMNGAAFATWGVQIPEIKARFGATDAMMSGAMLCVAGGAVLAMSSVGRWVARVGSARALTMSALAYSVALMAIPLAPRFAWLLPVLIAFGMSMAAFDVAMNVQAATVEQHLGRPVMSTMHGMFSLGGMAGAALGGLVLTSGVSLEIHAAAAAAIVAALAIAASGSLLGDVQGPPDANPLPHRRIPRELWVLGIVAFLGLVSEGAMYDWAAIYMRDVAGAATQVSGYGYAAFSTGMAAGRFGADFLRRRVSAQTILGYSTWLGFAGISLAIAYPSREVALAGLLLMGLGVANLMPFFFLAGTKLPGLSPAEGVAGVARFAYAGMLFGPPVIGAIAHLASLRVGLAAVAVTMGWIAISGIRRIRAIA